MPRPQLSPAARWFAMLAPALLCAGCGLSSGSSTMAGASALSPAPPAGSPTPQVGAVTPTGSQPVTAPPRPSPTGSAAATTGAAPPAGLTAADVKAGLTSQRFSRSGSGRLMTVPGDAPAPGRGRVVKVKVQIESGLAIDPPVFADYVMAVLNDPRGWGHDGSITFARTDGAASVRVVLASPDTSARICRPLQTFGRLSCRSGDAAVLTIYRWVKAIPEYGSDRTGYRRYVVSHEVGHLLGHGHLSCPGKGRRAPVMMQQTKGLKGCLPNSWPFP